MSISFKNTPFSINGNMIYALSATLTENVEYQRVEGLGRSNIDLVQQSRPNGSFSADFYLTSGDVDFWMSKTGAVRLTGQIGEIKFTEGYLNQFSFSIEPLSLIKGTIAGNFYQSLNWGSPYVDKVDISGLAGTGLAHGAKSIIVNHGDAFSFNYSVLQTVEPHFAIGETGILGYRYLGGEISVQIEGTGLQGAVDYNCSNNNPEIEVNLNSLCGGNLGAISQEGFKVISSEIQVSESSDIVGKIELKRYI